MKLLKYTVILTPEKDNPEVYNVSIPALPEIATFGESKAEARFMAQDAIELTISSRLEEGQSIPKDKQPQRLPRGSVKEEILVTVSHQVQSSPLTPDAKAAFT